MKIAKASPLKECKVETFWCEINILKESTLENYTSLENFTSLDYKSE